jgi:hypothetical protein
MEKYMGYGIIFAGGYMQLKRLTVLSSLLVLLLLSACNLGRAAPPAPTAIDPSVVLTQAAQMVFTAMTQTAQAWTPTPLPTETPVPSPTPVSQSTPLPTLPGFGTGIAVPTMIPTFGPPNPVPTSLAAGCSNSEYAGYTNPPAGTVFKPGQKFFKIWRLKNTGTCTWDDGFRLAYAGGDGDMGGQPYVITQTKDFVKPGETKDFGVWLTAPNVEKDYGSCWRMQDDRRNFFGVTVCAWFTVKK